MCCKLVVDNVISFVIFSVISRTPISHESWVIADDNCIQHFENVLAVIPWGYLWKKGKNVNVSHSLAPNRKELSSIASKPLKPQNSWVS